MNRILEWLLGLTPGKLEGAELSLSFSAGYSNWIILALAAGLAALAVLTVLCYLREGDTPRRTKLIIASFRIVVLVVVMALLFQPGCTLRYRKDFLSSVVVLVDDSLSMSLKDRYADPAQRRAVAGKLGVTPQALAATSRTEVVRQLLTRQRGPLARLLGDHPLVLARFPNPQAGGPYTQPLAVVDPPGGGEDAAAMAKVTEAMWGKLSSEGHETNIPSALRDVADRVADRRVAAIVLVSDGQITGGGGEAGNRLNAAIAHVRQRGIPLLAVGVGDPQPPQNVAVLRLQGPQEVRKGSTIELTAHMASRNCGGQEAQVRLFRKPVGAKEWTDTGAVERVVLAGEAASGRGEAASGPREGAGSRSREQEVVLRCEAGELGEFEYQARVEPLEGEVGVEDNAASTRLKVSDEKVKILLVSGDAGWEFQYLRNLLLRSPQLYAVSVWQQDAEREFNQEASTGMRLTQLPRTRQDVFNYDVVILYDPAYTQDGFDGEFARLLDAFIGDHHGGLCFIASNKYTDLNLAAPGPFDPLIHLLPVVLGRQALNLAEEITRGAPEAWPVLPTAEGLDHPVLRLGGNIKENLDLWKVLPGVYWAQPVLRLKPGASALAVSTDPARRAPDGSGAGMPLIAVQYFGKGRVLYLGSDETWRWRFLADGACQRRFWTNVVDFLASGRLQKKRVILTTGDDRFDVGDEVRIHVEAYDRDYRPLEADSVQVVLTDRATQKRQTVAMQRDPARKALGHYEALLPLKTVGAFDLTVEDQDPDAVAGKAITVTLPQAEFKHPEADLATLRTVGADGRFLMVQDCDRLADLVSPGKLTTYQYEPHDIWDAPLAIVLVVLLLGTEWVLRKRYNMA